MSDTAIDALRGKSLKAMTHVTKPHEKRLRHRQYRRRSESASRRARFGLCNRLICRPKRCGRGRSWLIAAIRAWTVADQLANECRALPFTADRTHGLAGVAAD